MNQIYTTGSRWTACGLVRTLDNRWINDVIQYRCALSGIQGRREGFHGAFFLL